MTYKNNKDAAKIEYTIFLYYKKKYNEQGIQRIKL